MIKNNNQINKVKSQNGIKNASASGITLVALVVTIVVLLILAGITIAALFSDNGIIATAQRAADETKTAQETAEGELQNLADQVGYATGSKVNITTLQTATTKPYLPTGYSVSTKDGEKTLQDGLVITDGANEYVWVEVPKTATVYPTAGTSITEFSNENLRKIRTDLKTYTATYQNSSYLDYWYCYNSKWSTKTKSADPLETVAANVVPANKSGSDAITAADLTLTSTAGEEPSTETTSGVLTYTQYVELYKAMLESIYKNGGFYIGRYEAGIETQRTAKTDEIAANLKPLSQANKKPINYVTPSQAQTLASRIMEGNSSYHSSLLFGIQWDLVLKHLETKIGADKLIDTTTNKNILTQDSTNWGNYYNSRYTTTAESSYSTNDGRSYTAGSYNKTADGYILLTTGASSQFSKQNIYDLAGNISEWTLDRSFNPYGPCTLRGGEYSDISSSRPGSSRGDGSPTGSSKPFGFRLSLY